MSEEMGITTDFTVNSSSSEFFHSHDFSQYRFYNFRSGNKHFGNVVHHEHEVGQGGRVYGSTSARTEDYR